MMSSVRHAGATSSVGHAGATSFVEATIPEPLRRFADVRRVPPARPFRSLKPLRFADAGLLAARGTEIEQLVRMIAMFRGVLLFGESGSGKSSLVNAGVLPRVIENGYWPHRVRIRQLASQEFTLEPIACSDTDDGANLPSAFGEASEFAAGAFVEAVTAAAAERGPLLLVFDQFEELVTLFPREPEFTDQQEAIVEAVLTLLRSPQLGGGTARPAYRPIPVKLVFSFREDYLANLEPLLERRPELIHQGVRLIKPPLRRAPDIIRAPFATFPGTYAPDISALADRIADALGTSDSIDETPLSELQIVCSRLYEAKTDPAAELARGVKELLQAHLQDRLGELADDEHDAAIAILSQLVTARGTRNVVARDTLLDEVRREQPQLSEATVVAALGKLEADAGLIRRELRHNVDLYELTSEFLIDWISEQRQKLEAEREKRAEEAARAEAAHRAIVRRRRIAIIMIVAAVIAVLGYAYYRSRLSDSHHRRVIRDERLQATAQNLLSSEPDAALLFALAAYRDNANSPAVQATLIAALDQAAMSPASAILHGSLSAVTDVAFDPVNPHLLAATSAGGGIRLWNTTGLRHPLSPVEALMSGVFSLAFSPDGRTLAVGLENGTVQLFPVTTRGLGKPSAPIRVERVGRPRIVIALAFSHDERLLAAARLDAGVTIILLARGRPRLDRPLRTLGRRPTAVRSLAFAPRTDTLATVTNKGVVALWNALTGRMLAQVRVSHRALYSVAFDPATKTPELATAGIKGDVYLWRAGATQPTVVASTRGGAVDAIAFSPNGALLAVGGSESAIRIVNLHNRGQAPALLTGHEGVVTGVAFSPDGTLASSSTDQTVRLWPIPPNNPFGRALPAKVGAVATSAYAPDGHGLVVGGVKGVERWPVVHGSLAGSSQWMWSARNVSSVGVSRLDGTIAAATKTRQLWLRMVNGKTMVRTTGQPIYALAFDPYRPVLAYGGEDGQIRLLSYRTGEVRKFGFPTDRIFSMAFSPTQPILASTGDDRVIRLWSTTTGRQTGMVAGDSDAVFSLAFTPDGRTLASGSADNAVRLWNVSRAREQGLPLLGHRGWVKSVALSNNGKSLASGSVDGTIRIWDVQHGTPIGQPLATDGRPINSVAFSPNGLSVIGGGSDGAIHVWPLHLLGDYARLRTDVCDRLGAGVSPAEWHALAPGVGYNENPC